MGLAQGGNLGAAQGSITINTTQAQQAVPVMQQVAQGITQAMNQVGAGANNAQLGLGQVASAINGITSAFGVSFGVQGIVQLGRMAVNAAEVATAYNRQSVAAVTLAGSQDQLNAKLAAYDRATGGVVDKTTELANVTKLMAVGFGDSVPEIEKFATVIRGISIAMGTTQDAVTQNLILELFTQRGARLDQLGLEYEKVKQRADELQASDSSLTSKMAYQNAVLEQAEQRFGKLAQSGAGAATGLEKAKASTSNLSLTIGQILGPTINAVGADFSRTLDRWQMGLQAAIDLTKMLATALHLVDPEVSATLKMKTGIGSNIRQAPVGMERTKFLEGEQETKLDWAKGIIQLNADTNEQLQKQNSDYQRQRADSERQFQTSTTRANEDFMLARARQEQDLADTIARIHSDAARREQRQADDLARNIAQATTDSAEKVADAREDANKRLVELDEDYEKARVKRASDLSDKLLDAAGDLDAKQVYELQRDAAKRETEAEDAHKDARDKIGEQLDEKLDDEAKSLAKSIRQQQDAYDRQLTDGREADAQRITDMEADAVKRREQEDYDFGIRMGRMQQDHDDQLAEMDRAQGERITQIQTHAQQERDQLDDEHKRALIDLGVKNDAWLKAIKKVDDDALDEFARLTNPIRVWLNHPAGILPTPDGLPTPSMGGYTVPGMSGSSTGSTVSTRNFNPNVTVNISGSTSLSKTDVEAAVHDALLKVFEETN